MVKQQANTEEESAFDRVNISDDALEVTDAQTKAEKKAAKKRAKKLATPEEKKQLKKKRLLIIGGVFLSVSIILLAVPFTRWPVINALGFRANSEIVVQEAQSKQNLAGASVSVDGVVLGTTDSEGFVRISNIKMGEQTVLVEKPGYSREEKKLTFSFGSNKHMIPLEAVGVKINFSVKNWLSEAPIRGAVLISRLTKSESNEKGEASVIIPPTDEETVVEVSAKGYLSRKITVDTKVTSREVRLVSDAKNYFISKRSGKFDIFSSHLDGSNQKKIIEGTGKEDPQLLQFVVHPNNKKAILVATREGTRAADRMVAGIYLVDFEKSSLQKIDEGSDIQLLDWSGETIFYAKTSPTLNYDDKNFTQLIGYNTAVSTNTVYARANYFAFLSVSADRLFFLPADGYRELKNPELTGITIASGSRQAYFKGKQISYGTQPSYGMLEFETSGGEYVSLSARGGQITTLERRPNETKLFAQRADGKEVAWAERRDGKGTLLVTPTLENKAKQIASLAGLTSPVRYVTTNLFVVRVVTTQETADFVVDRNSGKFAKIADVSNVGTVRYEAL